MDEDVMAYKRKSREPMSLSLSSLLFAFMLAFFLAPVLSQCPVGQFGEGCNGTCHCLDNIVCDSDTGHCTSGKCEKGYYIPPPCQTECPDGRYGIDCEEVCHCVNDTTCNKKTGLCPGNICHPDWYSYACSKRLPKLVEFPTIKDATCQSLNVTWKAWNADVDFGDLPIAQYRLYLRLNTSTAWQQVTIVNQDPRATLYWRLVTGLQADQYYVFRVDVHGSDDGKVVETVSVGAVSDPPTRIPCTTTTARPPVTIPVIVGTEIFNVLTAVNQPDGSVNVTWSLYPDIRRFQWNITLSYQLTGTGDCSPLNGTHITTLLVSQSDTEQRLAGLERWGRYEIVMSAQGLNDIAYVNGTEDITIITAETIPKGRVSQLRATDIQNTSLVLVWDSLPCDVRGGVLLHYEIKVMTSDNSVLPLSRTNMTSITVTNLTPFSGYRAAVRYVNSVGPGAYSADLAYNTTEGVPAAVFITGLVPTSTSLVVNFQPPSPTNGQLLDYYILYSRTSTFTDPESLTVDASLSQTPVIERLTPDTVFHVKVRSRTSAGWGPYGSAVIQRTQNVRPFPPSSLVQTHVNTSCVSLSWLPPDQTTVTVTGYRVTVSKTNSSTTATFTVPATANNYDYCSLDPGTQYTVTVSALSAGGEGTGVSVQVITEQEDPPVPPAPQLLGVTTTTATLRLAAALTQPSAVTYFYQVEVEWLASASTANSNLNARRRKRLAEVPGYVTGQLTPEAMQQSPLFVVGDGQDYGGFTNVPLDSGQQYQVYVVLVSQWNGLTKFSLSRLPSPFTTPLPTTTTVTTTTLVTNATTTEEVPSPEDDNGAFIGVIIALVCVIILIILLIIFIIWWRRRKSFSPESPYVPMEDEIKVKLKEPYNLESYWNRVTSLRESRYIVVGRDRLPDNQLVPINTDPPHAGPSWVTFKQEFESLRQQPSQEGSVEEALHHPERNRFPHILPYDHSLVQLMPDSSDTCTYVNANFMSGYRAARAYIAAQSPYDDVTAVDFWRLIHQQGVRTVVMLTNTVERNTVKCTQFWPQQGKAMIGQFCLELLEESVYADYACWDIMMRESSENYGRCVRLYDFTSWPEHGVPRDSWPLLDFRHKVRLYQGTDTSPILVHCGTGVSRTGVFIAVDSLLDQYGAEGRISVVSFVRKMRSERPLMVRTLKQYEFIYECVLEYYQAGHVLTDLDTIKDTFHDWTLVNPKTGNSYLRDQFELLQHLTPDLEREECATALLPANLTKNRHSDILPSDLHRPALSPISNMAPGNYINAIFVDGYRTANQFIVTQTPLHNTVCEFWRLIEQHRVTTIITMDHYNNPDHNAVHYWDPHVANTLADPFTVQLMFARQEENITVRELRVRNGEGLHGEERVVRQFQFNGWADKSHTPVCKTMALDLLEVALDYQHSCPQPHGPIVIHCEDGAMHSGMLVCLSVLCERMEEEREVDVYHVIKHVKRRRPAVISDYEQYRFCYKALWDYLNLRMTGGPFTDTLGQTPHDKLYGVASMNLASHNHEQLY